MTKTSKAKATKATELVAGKFKAGTFRAKTFELLSDGKARNADQIVQGVGGKSHLNKRSARQFVMPVLADIKGAGFKIDETDNGFVMAKKATK